MNANSGPTQRIMVPDYIDGVKKLNWGIGANFLEWVGLFHKAIDIVGPRTIRILPPKESFYTQYPELIQEWDTFQYLVKKDEGFKKLVVGYKYYLEDPKNYVISKSLKEALRKTKQNIKIKHMPDYFNGYLEIPNLLDEDNSLVAGIFASIRPLENEERILNISTVTNIKSPQVGYLTLDLSDCPPDTSMEDLVKNHTRLVTKANKEKTIIIKTEEETVFHECTKVILNTIMYITSSNAELVNEINQFSSKPSKYTAQKKIYTPKPYIFVGKNFQMPRRGGGIKCGEFPVSGHWRWQPHGPGMSLHKWIYIEEYLKGAKNE